MIPNIFCVLLRFFAANVRTVLLDSAFEGTGGPPIPTFPIFHGLISVRVTAPNSP
jgi:hypothetical protein